MKWTSKSYQGNTPYNWSEERNMPYPPRAVSRKTTILKCVLWAKKNRLKAGLFELPQLSRPVLSYWSSKKDSTLLLRVDYRHFDVATISDTYSLPFMDDVIDSLEKLQVFTSLDALWGYRQVPITVEEKEKNTFTTHHDTYRYNRTPHRLRNTPATF